MPVLRALAGLVLAGAFTAGGLRAQDPPAFAFVGLHGGVYAHLAEHAKALPVRIEYLADERIARGDVDWTRYASVFVQHLRDDTGVRIAAAAEAARAAHRPFRVFALSGGGNGGRPRQLTEKPEHKDLIERDADLQAYYGSSVENLRRLLVCALVKYHGASLTVEPPLPVPALGIFHPELGGPIDLAQFEQHVQRRGAEYAARPRVAVIAHDLHMQMQQPAVVEALVRGLEQQGLCACAVLDTGEGLARFRPQYEQLLKDLKLQAIVHTCHSTDRVEMREELDVPHLHSVFLRRQSIAEWQADPQGIAAHEIAFQIAGQEALGAIEPQIGAGTLRGGGDAEAMVPIAERIEHLVRRTKAWVDLRTTPIAQKRVAILYYNSGVDKRGLARGTATGMFLNGPQSLVAVLQRLQRDGYGVADVPKDEDELLAKLIRGGRQLLPNDARGLAELVRDCAPVLIPVAQFTQWLEKRVPAAARKLLEERWGPAPGKFMVWRDERGEAFLVVPRVEFGNVTLLPQPLRGETYDSATAHDKLAAPPYNYLATYFWLQEQWRAQAMVHFGTHGSDIALPGKATGLAADDWTDICMGTLPNVYPWIVENLGEAAAAKRRSYGVLIGHLPPPVQGAGLSPELTLLHDDLEKMRALDAGGLRERFRTKVSAQAKRLQLDRDLGVTFPPDAPLDDATLERLDTHLHALMEEPIPTALHTLGEVPTDEQLVPHLVTCLHKSFLERLAAVLPGKADGGHTEHLRPLAERLLRAVAVEGKTDAEALAAIGATLPAEGVPPKLAADLALASQLRAGYLKTGNELDGLLEALAGRFVSPGPGRAPDRNPAVLPTGRNLYLLNQDEVPSQSSWELGKQLADDLLAEWQRDKGRLPTKVAFTLNAGATFQDFGVTESQILRLLGVEPIWNERNLVKDVRVLSREELGRPRVDVMIASGGRYYANLPSRMELIERALQQVQAIDEADNALRQGTATMLAELQQRGMPAAEAQRLASARIFGFGNGDSSAGNIKFSAIVERSSEWDSRSELMEEYMARDRDAFVGGEFVPAPRAAFESVLRGTEVVLRTWSRSTESPLSNRYQWLHGGSLAAAVEFVTGTAPDMRLVDVRDPDRAANVDASLALRRDFRARLLNPKWIAGMQTEGYAGADQVAVHVGNAFGWETMRKGAVTKELWDELKQVYLDDSLRMGMREWFDKENPWAQQAIASTLLDAARKGFWNADAQTLADVAKSYLESVERHGRSGGLRDGGSGKIKAFAESKLRPEAKPESQPEPQASAPPVTKPVDASAPVAKDAPQPRQHVVGQKLERAPEPQPATDRRAFAGMAIGIGALLCFLAGLLRRPS